jgi:hypothetical protein
MKLAALTLALFAGLACAAPPAPTLSLTTVNKVQSAAAVSAYSLGAGSSLSTATGFHTATSFVAGEGSLSATRNVGYDISLADCAPTTWVNGTMINGNLGVNGLTSVTGYSDASNVSTGAGTGGAESTGLATAAVTGSAALAYKSFDMKVDGNAFSGALTRATAALNGSDASSGHTSSSFASKTDGQLFKFATATGFGDVKIVNVDLKARAGDLTCTSGCGSTSTDTASFVNATIEAGAGGTATTTIIVTKP